MSSAVSGIRTDAWLIENGPKELELLFRAIVFQPQTPILLTDDDRQYRDASVGASALLGVPREDIVGRNLDDFAASTTKPAIPKLWQGFLKEGKQTGTLQLVGADGSPREVEYTAKGNVLPVRHILLLRNKAQAPPAGGQAASGEQSPIDSVPAWVQDYALFLLNTHGQIAAWYEGAERIYGYPEAEAVKRDFSFLSTDPIVLRDFREGLETAARAGHVGIETWQCKQDGSQFWANMITLALKDESGVLRGYGCVVRDFSDRHERDEKLRLSRARLHQAPPEQAIVGIVSGEFDRTPEVNDAFLDLVGYTRDDLQAGNLNWPALTPPEYSGLDELAHEEGLRFGACTPFEKELIRKDKSRVPVLVTTAVLQLSPFRWITFVTDLRNRNLLESIQDEVVEPKHNFEEIVGTSAVMRRVMAQVEVVAPTDATVLVLGETGTGKELVARAIHRVSPRRNLPFISLNCAAIPTGLLESELFGYERGAFTGALSQKIGRFEMAHKGTLFLDEVGDIPIDLQPKLLRALQEKSFERLGGTRTIPIDVRLVAATNRNLAQMMGDKLFRSDLYYRLKVFPITTPALRDHPEDIPILARHFTKKYAAKMNRTIDKIPPEIMKALTAWSWPGNVRELENFIERSVIFSNGSRLRAPVAELVEESVETTRGTLEEVERDHILRVFRETGGVVSATAARLGIPRTTLNALMTRLGITRRDM